VSPARAGAAAQLTRIVQLVAELTRAAREGGEARTLVQLAESFGVTPAQIAADLRTLTLLGDHADADWLLSLSVWQQRDRVSVRSAGPFRRPVRLTPHETLALQAALLLEGEVELAGRFTPPEEDEGARERGHETTSRRTDDDAFHTAADRLAVACARGRRARIRYAAEGRPEPSAYLVEVHQVVEHAGSTYFVAWCPELGEWRRFRDDRVLEADLLEEPFEPRPDHETVEGPGELLRTDADPERATIRYSRRVARWLRERYPEHEEGGDGSILVRVPVANPHWLVRRVLEYGTDAELLEPPHFREAIRRAVS